MKRADLIAEIYHETGVYPDDIVDILLILTSEHMPQHPNNHTLIAAFDRVTALAAVAEVSSDPNQHRSYLVCLSMGYHYNGDSHFWVTSAAEAMRALGKVKRTIGRPIATDPARPRSYSANDAQEKVIKDLSKRIGLSKTETIHRAIALLDKNTC